MPVGLGRGQNLGQKIFAIFFKEFSGSFKVHFQGVFKDFSLFFQTSIHEKMINNGLLK